MENTFNILLKFAKLPVNQNEKEEIKFILKYASSIILNLISFEEKSAPQPRDRQDLL